MLFWLGLFFILLIILFFLSRAFSKNLYLLFFRLTKNNESAIQLLTWALLPGTIIHELSHLLCAGLLRVPTSELSFRPEIRANEVKAGGLKMARIDPFRHTLIGLAPIITGISIITFVTHFYLYPQIQTLQSIDIKRIFSLFVLCSLLFIVSNTMFSSKKDLEPILLPLLLILICLALFYVLGIQISLSPRTIDSLTLLLKNLDLALIGTLIIDAFSLLLIKLFL